MSRASYQVVEVKGDSITLHDLDGKVSITNDAEAVVAEILQAKGRMNQAGQPWRIYYYDTMGNLDELLHSGGRFTGFAPIQVEGRNK